LITQVQAVELVLREKDEQITELNWEREKLIRAKKRLVDFSKKQSVRQKLKTSEVNSYNRLL